jgi:hypothetical protein
MFSAGLGAQRLDILKGCKQVFAILVSASSKTHSSIENPRNQHKTTQRRKASLKRKPFLILLYD